MRNRHELEHEKWSRCNGNKILYIKYVYRLRADVVEYGEKKYINDSQKVFAQKFSHKKKILYNS